MGIYGVIMLFFLIVDEVRVRGRVRVTMSIGTVDIVCLKTIQFQITTKMNRSGFLLRLGS